MTETEIALQQHIEALSQECELWKAKFQKSEEAYSLLVSQVKDLRRHIFGCRSERYVDPENPQQALDFTLDKSLKKDAGLDGNEASSESGENKNTPEDNVVSITAYQRKKSVERQFSPHLPRKEVLISVENHDRHC